MLCHEYGWSIEYILKRTFKEVDYLIHAITRRKGTEAKFKASLHGKKIKGLVIPKRKTVKKEVTKEEKIIDASITKAFEKRLAQGL